MMRGSQDKPSETGLCFSVDFSYPQWDEEVPHYQLFLPNTCKGLTDDKLLKFEIAGLGSVLSWNEPCVNNSEEL